MITVFLRKYTDASSTEVGGLLMALPFLSCLTKPLFCALADRNQSYRFYFVLSLLLTLLGFGPYTLVPFWPRLVASHGRLCWYLLAATTLVGHLAHGVAWSLGDALAANVSHRTGESFGLIRLWGTIGWGVAGALVAALSPHLGLPELVPGLLVFVLAFCFEIALLWWWPNERDFQMCQPTEPHRRVAVQLGGVAEKQQQQSVWCTQSKQQQVEEEEAARLERAKIARLQVSILKLLCRKHKSLIKYLIIFTLLGTVYNIHWSFFFLHLDQLARQSQATADLSTLVGVCLVAQAAGETLCFALAPWAVARLGREGAISLNALAYAVRYFGNGLGIPLLSPYVAILTESLQGINYGIFYYLITDTALQYALLVEDVIPELHARGLLDKGADLKLVRSSLRATMQGVFSGAFDGLGFGLGSLVAGLVLEGHSYEQLWCYAGTAALAIFILHALYELTSRFVRRTLRTRRNSYARQLQRYDSSLGQQSV